MNFHGFSTPAVVAIKTQSRAFSCGNGYRRAIGRLEWTPKPETPKRSLSRSRHPESTGETPRRRPETTLSSETGQVWKISAAPRLHSGLDSGVFLKAPLAPAAQDNDNFGLELDLTNPLLLGLANRELPGFPFFRLFLSLEDGALHLLSLVDAGCLSWCEWCQTAKR